MRIRSLTAAALLLVSVPVAMTVTATPAAAASRVTVANEFGQARIDDTYTTTIQVSGSGFQSIKGGHGGIYVFFGTVRKGWQPSAGGATGADYFYVPDSESKNNQGYQKFVAFPGSDTGGSANGGAMSGDGGWSTTLTVPSAVFQAFDRNGGSREVDCRKVTCGVITVGAHGVVNARNETFTPVSVGKVYTQKPTSSPTSGATSSPGAGGSPTTPPTTTPSGGLEFNRPPALRVDRPSAVAGNVLSFTARRLPPGSQVSVILDDGLAAAGPFVVGPDGRITGVITVPLGVAGGTHELRLFGVPDAPLVRFPIVEGAAPPTDEPVTAAAADTDDSEMDLALAFVALAALALVASLVGLVVRRGGRRAT